MAVHREDSRFGHPDRGTRMAPSSPRPDRVSEAVRATAVDGPGLGTVSCLHFRMSDTATTSGVLPATDRPSCTREDGAARAVLRVPRPRRVGRRRGARRAVVVRAPSRSTASGSTRSSATTVSPPRSTSRPRRRPPGHAFCATRRAPPPTSSGSLASAQHRLPARPRARRTAVRPQARAVPRAVPRPEGRRQQDRRPLPVRHDVPRRAHAPARRRLRRDDRVVPLRLTSLSDIVRPSYLPTNASRTKQRPVPPRGLSASG